MAECTALRAWAEAQPLTISQPANPEQIANQMRFLAARLPSQAHDDGTGRMRAAVDVSMLSGWPNDAIAFMCREALKRFKWFPVPAQMLDILSEFRHPETERAEALRVCGRFAQHAFEAWKANLRNGQPIGDVPDQWLRIAECEGLLRRMADGEYVNRAEVNHGE